MTIFGKHLWHNWDYFSIYYDCSEVCIWSSGKTYYRECKECGKLEEQYNKKSEWVYSTTNIDRDLKSKNAYLCKY